MPTIQKQPKKPKTTYHSDTDMRLLRRKAYGNPQWKKVRDAYIKAHPICEECLKEGVVYAGDGDKGTIQVHHVKTPFKGGVINYDLLLDNNNLRTLCGYHHGLEHTKKEKTAQEILRELDMLFDENVTDEELEDDNK